MTTINGFRPGNNIPTAANPAPRAWYIGAVITVVLTLAIGGAV